jgi:hypothetical protein
MRKKQRQFEEGKARRDYWMKQLPIFVGSAAIVGLASVLIYRYSIGGPGEI